MFWVLTSAVEFWTLYESLMMWAYVNGIALMITFDNNAAWFILLLFIAPLWTGFHFYRQHRMFHIPLLYKLAHYLHHNNTNVGPFRAGHASHRAFSLVKRCIVAFVSTLPSNTRLIYHAYPDDHSHYVTLRL